MCAHRVAVVAALILWVSSAQAGPAPTSRPATQAASAPATMLGYLPREGLIAYWPGDGDGKDRAGACHGQLLAGARFAPGKVGSAFRFDGNGAHLATPSTAILSGAGAFTVSMWVKAPGDGTLLTKGILFPDMAPRGQDTYCLQIAVHEDEGRRVRVTAVGGRGAYAEPAHAAMTERRLGKDRWYHLAVVFDAGALAVYLDGVREPVKLIYYRHSGENWPVVDTPQIDRLATAEAVVRIGCAWSHRNRTSVPEDSFVGLIDEVAVWGRALKAHEIHLMWAMSEFGPAAEGMVLPQVARPADVDRLILTDDLVLDGTFEPNQVRILTGLGTLQLDFGSVVGLERTNKPGTFRLLLADGQAVQGEVDLEAISLRQATGKILRVELEKIRQAARRLDPSAPPPAGPAPRMLYLRTGERLAWTGLKAPCRLQTDYGAIDLAATPWTHLRPAGAGWLAMLAGGSALSGTIEPNQLSLQLVLGPEAGVPLDRLAGLTCPSVDTGGRDLEPAVLRTRAGDMLVGELATRTLSVKTASGPASVPAVSVHSLEADANRPGRVLVRLWGGSEVRGEWTDAEVPFEMRGGPKLALKPAAVASISLSLDLAKPEMAAQVERWIAQLGAASFRDRDAATRALTAMGSRIAPLLRKHANDPDPEVRTRIETILEAVGAAPASVPPPPGPGRRAAEDRAVPFPGP